MRNKNYPFIPDSYLNDHIIKGNKTYKARNLISYSIISALEQAPEQELPSGDIPATPVEPGSIPEEVPVEVGYISVGVFTASGALPVEDAVVTVYILDNQGEENVISHLVSDANGQVPTIELPVIYNRFNPLESSEYFFSTYNLRVQAINYYTYNIIDFRVFPETTTSFMIELIPVAAGPSEVGPEMTFVIPPSPIDISND